MGKTIWTGLLLLVAIGLAGCGDDSDASDTAARDTPQTSTPGVDDSTAGEALFTDSFDDDRNKWGVLDDPEYGTTSYSEGDYVWVFKGSVAHWLPEVLGKQFDQGELDMHDVVVRTDATVDSGKGVIGVFCRETPDTDADWQWYEFVARDGYAAIRHADQEANIEVLAETDEVSVPAGESVTIEGTCVDDADGDAQLTMRLNDSVVLEASDDTPLGNGAPGIQAWTYPVHSEMNIRWHDFTVEQATP